MSQIVGTTTLNTLDILLQDYNQLTDPNEKEKVHQELGKLWIEVNSNVSQSKLLNIMINENIQQQVREEDTINKLTQKKDYLKEQSEKLKEETNDIAKLIDACILKCQDAKELHTKERESIQNEYKLYLDNTMKEYDVIKLQNDTIQAEKDSLLEEIKLLLKDVSDCENEYDLKVKPLLNIEKSVESIDEEMRCSTEQFQMMLADQEVKIKYLADTEQVLKSELLGYSKKFDEVFSDLETNKNMYEDLMRQNNDLNQNAKKVLKSKEVLSKKYINLLQNKKVSYGEIDNALKLKEKLVSQIDRYNNLYAAIEKEISCIN